MVDVDIYTINNEEYYLLAEEIIMNISYLYLSKVDDESYYMIRKRDKENPEILLPLDNENEVKMAALVLTSKILEQK